MTANAAVGDFDLMDPEVLGSPYDFYAALREHAPVHLTPYGFWLISRYDDVLAVVRDPDPLLLADARALRGPAESRGG